MLVIALITMSSSFAIFERTKNFFTGGRYYDDSDYYDGYGRRYDRSYYRRSSPRFRRYVTGASLANKTSVTEDANRYFITIVLPGFQKEDVSVSVVENTIQVNALGTKIEQSGLANQPINSFAQTIPLDDDIKATEVQSAYVNGVLTITAPKVTQSSKGLNVPVK